MAAAALGVLLTGIVAAAATVVVLDGQAGVLDGQQAGGTGAGDDAGAAEGSAASADGRSPAGPGGQSTLLLVRTPGSGGPATSLTLLAGSANGSGLVLFIPTGTITQIRGFGLRRLGDAAQLGGASLVEASVETLLGIDVDHVAVTAGDDLATFLHRSDGLALDVATRLVERLDDGSATVRFEAGRQFMGGGALAGYWDFRAEDEDELTSMVRQRDVLAALLNALDADVRLRDRMLADGAPELGSDADADWLTGLFAHLAGAAAAGDLDYDVLPVEPAGEDADGTATYRVAAAEARGLVDRLLAGSKPDAANDEIMRVQVLNGVGTPGIGAAVDRRLEGAGFHILPAQNARDFDFVETRILTYDESPASLAAAQRVRELLGVGTIQVSRQPQSLVDMSIVVGADFGG